MRHSTAGWLLLAPTLVILFVTGLLPFLYVLVVSFFDWNVFAQNPEPRFAGVNNFRRLVFDAAFLKSIWLTLKFTFFVVVSEVVVGFALARLMLRDFPLKNFFRGVHTLPLMIAPIAVGATWRLMTVPGLGPIPYYLDRWFGIDYRLSLHVDQAFFTVVLMDIWHWTPLVTLTLLAGLSNLPKDPVEQARIDGAGEVRIFWDIVIPLLKPVLLTTIFIRLMDALRIVDEVWMLTGGGPGDETILQLKATPLVATITVVDIYAVASRVRSDTFIVHEPLLLLALIYMIIAGIIALIFRRFESRVPVRPG